MENKQKKINNPINDIQRIDQVLTGKEIEVTIGRGKTIPGNENFSAERIDLQYKFVCNSEELWQIKNNVFKSIEQELNVRTYKIKNPNQSKPQPITKNKPQQTTITNENNKIDI